ncbi:MAG: phosphoribosylformylglycinamidine synthase subunit PurS [Candidatus Omnitrophica bacterium]|nr:phosphoribosylformylglycinamidine synthase subunit PurS [Candidatus Omnitrophota bacterium]MDD5237661.1 phosphoribosylformylglycinamidine synthase subunit PurS [Candidatus Omnitrophota bacterium]
MIAEIYISLKRTVSDPQGLTVKHALESLGYKELGDVRIGRLIVINLNLKDKKMAQEQVDQMCKKLLANPIIEDYHFKIRENK